MKVHCFGCGDVAFAGIAAVVVRTSQRSLGKLEAEGEMERTDLTLNLVGTPWGFFSKGKHSWYVRNQLGYFSFARAVVFVLSTCCADPELLRERQGEAPPARSRC